MTGTDARMSLEINQHAYKGEEGKERWSSVAALYFKKDSFEKYVKNDL